MARGARASPGPASLPKIQYEKVKDKELTGPIAGVSDGQARSFGYNEVYSEFTRPDYYIRHIEPLEIDLARQVEYDMDEQDKEWLDVVNVERRKDQTDQVSFETFEIIMDRLEKEWFDLTKNLTKPDLAMPSEDSTCAICDDSEGENSNAIVFCDGCNLAVHQDCYGVPYIPEGQWLCRKCTVSPENPVQCFLCPNEGGAFKQTIHGEWVHLLCAIWVPETRVANEVFMEPITGVERISKQRWRLKCSICDVRDGACIQCAKSTCVVAFHATCARQHKFLLPMKTTQGSEPVTLQAYCEKHLPKEQQDARLAALATEENKTEQMSSQLGSKSARAYNKTYKPGPPIVPAIIVNRIVQYTAKLRIRKKLEFVHLVCKYWSLKREARRGAPLLKRLHLEPWTASGGKIQTDEEKQMKLDQLQRLRQDLVKLRTLTQLTRLRETRKLRQTELIHQVLSIALFPHEAALRMSLEHIMASDRSDFFKHPVNKNEVPDYFDIILNPMCWSMIEERLDKHEYWDVKTFKDDVGLVIDNALTYNKQGTPFFKAALRLRTISKPILDKLDKLVPPGNPEAIDSDTLPPVGDLEPPLHILQLLTSSGALQDGLNLELSQDPISSLFSCEVAKYRSPPTASPERPAKSKKKKRDRKAEYEKSRAKRAARTESATPAVDTETGFPAPPPSSSPTTTTYPESEVAPPRKRASSSSLRLPGAPRVVDDVDRRDSFQLFNAGWILPPDHRRGGRAAPAEKSMPNPPRKRQKTEHPSSRPSIVSTAASDNQTLQTPAPEDSQFREPKEEAKMDIDLFSAPPGIPAPPGTPFIGDIISRTATDSSGRIIIEELDTPYTRKQKQMRRKAEKERLKREAEGEDLSVAGPDEGTESSMVEAPNPLAEESLSSISTAAPPANSKGKQLAIKDDDSDLSELSDLSSADGNEPESDDNEEVDPGPNRTPAGAVDAGRNRRGPPPRRAAKVDNYEGGTLVWAKAESFPWWPAVVFDADHVDVPPNIVRDHKETKQRRKIKLYIVRFYDRTNSWQYLPRDKLMLLGEDSQLDSDMLAPQSLHQKWKSTSARQNCRDAFKKASAEMETNNDGENPVDQLMDVSEAEDDA
ncbi:hypothetical protein FA15DRAFT_313371 [Coprinopsis marcescibilis]|uniref:Bromodomain and PHD finger-containing protein 3 n=1 Tax=Coprinopsis marcescibilis TaxID=230819 RepID=A0A5C3KCK9_COPMA|nr:hypothetical protein FA15DRAFT_313371 [Coprinopsis marcescibilis]